MRVIIDTNSLQTDELRLFLNSSDQHRAVIPEHSVAEIFKPKSNAAIFSSLSLLCEYRDQVIVLKSNRRATKVDPKVSAISNHFIDRRTTRDFPEFCEIMNAASSGHQGYLDQIAQRREWAIERVQNAQDSFGDQSEALSELSSNFSNHELREIRAGRPLKKRSKYTILEMTNRVADDLFSLHSPGKHIHPFPYRYNQFVWRYALCHIVQLMELVRKGAKRRAPDKARNDHFDNVFATFGTYFNGIMTNDSGPLLTQHIARIVLKVLGARLAPDYGETEYVYSLGHQCVRRN